MYSKNALMYVDPILSQNTINIYSLFLVILIPQMPHYSIQNNMNSNSPQLTNSSTYNEHNLNHKILSQNIITIYSYMKMYSNIVILSINSKLMLLLIKGISYYELSITKTILDIHSNLCPLIHSNPIYMNSYSLHALILHIFFTFLPNKIFF